MNKKYIKEVIKLISKMDEDFSVPYRSEEYKDKLLKQINKLEHDYPEVFYDQILYLAKDGCLCDIYELSTFHIYFDRPKYNKDSKNWGEELLNSGDSALPIINIKPIGVNSLESLLPKDYMKYSIIGVNKIGENDEGVIE